MDLRVVQIGNSGGILIPKETRQEMGIRIGENVTGELKGKKLIITNPKAKRGTRVLNAKTEKNRTKLRLTPEFKEWLDEVSTKHENLIKELAKR